MSEDRPDEAPEDAPAEPEDAHAEPEQAAEPERPTAPDQPTAPPAPPVHPTADEWASPGWSPPTPSQEAPAPSPPVRPGPPQPGYPPAGYPQQLGYPQQSGYPQPPAHQQPGYPPRPGYSQQYGQVPPGAPPSGDAWYPQQPHYAPGWQAPVGAPPSSRRRGARIALVVIAGIAAVALVVGGVIGGRYWLETRPLGEVTKPMTVHAGRLGTGHCLAELPADGTVSSARVVPCGEPHVAEVVGSRALSGTSWPGTEQVTMELEKWCEMDTAEQQLGLRPVVWAPTEQGWNQGSRTGLCLAWLPTGTMTGSFVAHDQVTVP